MANPAVIVRLLWIAARAVGAASAARRAGTGQQLARNIVRLANQLRKGNRALRDLSDDDLEGISRELAREGVTFRVAGQSFRCSERDFR